MIIKIFSPKNLAKKLAFGLREKRHFFAENWEKSQKIVIITPTPEMFG
jgi:hypothetical protein